MSLTHAILGLLHDQPMTGYDLKTQAFDASIAHFWPADQAQIYRTLDKMTEEGWITSQLEVQETRPNRKIYTLTDSGRAELRRWLNSFQPLVTYREPFLIQLFFVKDFSNAQIITMIEAQLAAHHQRLTQYQEVPVPPLNTSHITRETTLQRLTLELGLRVEQAHIDWLLLAREIVQALPEDTSS